MWLTVLAALWALAAILLVPVAKRVARHHYRELMATLQQVEKQSALLELQVLSERRRKDEIFGCVVKMEEQRDEWRSMYHQHAIEHGNAQALLFNECQRLAMLCRKHGVQVTVSDQIKQAVLDYEEAHVELASKALPEVKRIPLQKDQD